MSLTNRLCLAWGCMVCVVVLIIIAVDGLGSLNTDEVVGALFLIFAPMGLIWCLRIVGFFVSGLMRRFKQLAA